ncbi:MAG: Ribonuclease BN [Candidatus Heimdallarchaeota archaeon AB_125]|nr:MAG: Ribonuclease BN [Candidatus Heimdallarchaeota archaeon AB_125]
MEDSKDVMWDWSGNNLRVKVLFSSAGLATQILVNNIEKDSNLLIDVGDGILRDLVTLPGKYYENIDIILITHGHFDHVGGLFSLLAFFRMINRSKKLLLISPSNVVELEGLVKTFFESYGDSIPFELELITIEKDFEIDDILISAFPVQHRGSIIGGKKLPDIPSVGYIINKNTERILYTGDTGYFEQLKEYAKDVDYALIEGTYKDKKTKFHLTHSEAEEIGKLAKHYQIIHQIMSR